MRRRLEDGMAATLGFTYKDPLVATTPRIELSMGEDSGGGRQRLPSRGRSPEVELSPESPVRTGLEGGGGRRVPGGPARPRTDRRVLLVAEGYRAEVLCDDNRLVDRAAAVRAGIGWWGKNSMVLIPGIGPWAVIGSVATDADLAPDQPLDRIAGPAQHVSRPAPPERWSPPACSTPVDAWPHGRNAPGWFRPSTGSRWATASTDATIAWWPARPGAAF